MRDVIDADPLPRKAIVEGFLWEAVVMFLSTVSLFFGRKYDFSILKKAKAGIVLSETANTQDVHRLPNPMLESNPMKRPSNSCHHSERQPFVKDDNFRH